MHTRFRLSTTLNDLEFYKGHVTQATPLFYSGPYALCYITHVFRVYHKKI